MEISRWQTLEEFIANKNEEKKEENEQTRELRLLQHPVKCKTEHTTFTRSSSSISICSRVVYTHAAETISIKGNETMHVVFLQFYLLGFPFSLHFTFSILFRSVLFLRSLVQFCFRFFFFRSLLLHRLVYVRAQRTFRIQIWIVWVNGSGKGSGAKTTRTWWW